MVTSAWIEDWGRRRRKFEGLYNTDTPLKSEFSSENRSLKILRSPGSEVVKAPVGFVNLLEEVTRMRVPTGAGSAEIVREPRLVERV